MVQNLWVPQDRKTTLCVDNYENGVMQGRLYGADTSVEPFESFIQFLVKMDMILEERQVPQAYTAARTFSPFCLPLEPGIVNSNCHKGQCATFELQILFRQYSTWQGVLVWKEKDLKQNFRSVLELTFLIDSALRGLEEKEAV